MIIVSLESIVTPDAIVDLRPALGKKAALELPRRFQSAAEYSKKGIAFTKEIATPLSGSHRVRGRGSITSPRRINATAQASTGHGGFQPK
jgi:hypothetical protein